MIESNRRTMKSKKLAVALGIFLVTLVCFCFYEIMQPSLTSRESLLFSVLLTIASVLGSGIVTKYYADFSARDNLRFFALKAAEKVTNLSNELNKLTLYLHEELETSPSDYKGPNEALLAKELKIEFAIQMINTLKSMNDKSLSDWQGVIGDEITAKEEQQEEREEHLRELIDKLELLHSEIQSASAVEETTSTTALEHDLETIKKEMRGLAAQVSGVPFTRSVSNKPKKQPVEKNCPVCSHQLKYRQRPLPSGLKGLRCTECQTQLVSQFKNNEFVIEKNQPILEKISCTACQSPIDVLLDPVPGSSTIAICSACENQLRVTRAGKALRIRLVSTAAPSPETVPLAEGFIEQVKKLMPTQPWPKGTGKAVAAQLGVPNHTVARAVNELIKRGLFKVQIDGQLYEAADSLAKPSNGGLQKS